MQITREATLAFVLLSCIAASVVGTIEDGLPRPLHFADEPTTSYGAYPKLMNANMTVADCDWYGFANTLYSYSQALSCLDEMRTALTNATENSPSSLQPYVYYTLLRMTDPANNQSYCYQGCFKLDGFSSTPASSPGYAPAPYFRGPSLASVYSPVGSPISYDVPPAIAPTVADSPYYSPEGSPAQAPGPESGL